MHYLMLPCDIEAPYSFISMFYDRKGEDAIQTCTMSFLDMTT